MEFINASDAPPAAGPYSHSVKAGPFLFLSGQLPLDPDQNKVLATDIEGQTSRVFENIRLVLAASDLTTDAIVKTTVFLSDMNNFQRMNAVYEKEFAGHKPARSTVEVARLPLDVLVEIECIALHAGA